MKYKGSLSAGGKVYLSDLEIHLEQTPSDWRGSIVIPQGEFVSAGRFQLTLSDGRSGSIVIANSPLPGHNNSTAEFFGSGPLQ